MSFQALKIVLGVFFTIFHIINSYSYFGTVAICALWPLSMLAPTVVLGRVQMESEADLLTSKTTKI